MPPEKPSQPPDDMMFFCTRIILSTLDVTAGSRCKEDEYIEIAQDAVAKILGEIGASPKDRSRLTAKQKSLMFILMFIMSVRVANTILTKCAENG